MTDLLAGLGGALGGLFGGLSSLASTQAGVGAVGDLTSVGAAQVAPYNLAGMSYINPISQDLTGNTSASQAIGQGRMNMAANPLDFQQFAKNYNTSEGAQYLMRTAQTAQDSSAAARGGLLSGANMRSQFGIAEGIANQDLLEQYKATLQGQQQDFQQRETSYQNMYGQEAMGLQAGIAEAGTFAQGARAIGQLYQGLSAQANQSGNLFGNAIGSIFGAIKDAFK